MCGKYTSITNLYPTYSIGIVTPPGSRVRIGTRRIYADVPYQVYELLLIEFLIANASSNDEKMRYLRDKLNIEKEIHEKLRLPKFYTVSIYRHPSTHYVRLSIRWREFLKYLDGKAKELVTRIASLSSSLSSSKRGFNEAAKLVNKFYREEILGNYLNIINKLSHMPMTCKPAPLTYSMITRKIDKSLIRRLLLKLGYIDEVRGVIEELMYLVRLIEKNILKLFANTLDKPLMEKVSATLLLPTAELSTSLLEVLREIKDCAEVHSAYLQLRRFIEELYRVQAIYKSLLKLVKNNSLKECSESIVEKIRDEVTRKLYSMPFKQSELRSLCRELSIIYSVISEILHKIPPMPYESILEYLIFKEILKLVLNYTKKFIQGSMKIRIRKRSITKKPTKQGIDPWERLEYEWRGYQLALKLLENNREKLGRFINEVLSNKSTYEVSCLIKILMSGNYRKGLLTEQDFGLMVSDLIALKKGTEFNLIWGTYLIEDLIELLKQEFLREGVTNDEVLAEYTAFYVLVLNFAAPQFHTLYSPTIY